jgi:hypothetical protein
MEGSKKKQWFEMDLNKRGLVFPTEAVSPPPDKIKHSSSRKG